MWTVKPPQKDSTILYISHLFIYVVWGGAVPHVKVWGQSMGTSSPHLPPGNRDQTQVVCLAASAFTCWAPLWLDSRILEVEKINLMWYATYCGHVLVLVTSGGRNKENAFFLTTSSHTPTSWHTQPYSLLNAHSKQNCSTQCGGHCILCPLGL